jgi:hypothetical protein
MGKTMTIAVLIVEDVWAMPLVAMVRVNLEKTKATAVLTVVDV